MLKIISKNLKSLHIKQRSLSLSGSRLKKKKQT